MNKQAKTIPLSKPLTDDQLHYVVNYIRSNYILVDKSEELIKAELMGVHENRLIELAFHATASVLGMSLDDITSERQSQWSMNARKYVIAILRTVPDKPMSYPKIGYKLNRTHATILSAERSFNNLYKTDVEFRHQYDKVKSIVEQSYKQI